MKKKNLKKKKKKGGEGGEAHFTLAKRQRSDNFTRFLNLLNEKHVYGWTAPIRAKTKIHSKWPPVRRLRWS